MIPQQRSPAWLKWRRDKVTATDAGPIMGNGFKSIGELLDQKLGIRPPDEENAAMARGNALEDQASTSFEIETGHLMFPQVCINPFIPWMTASLDGMTLEKDVAVEIKCPGEVTAYKTFHEKVVPEYYIPQLQHQMAVTGLKSIYYYSYFPGNENSGRYVTLLKVLRDDSYIEKLIERETRFYHLLMKGISEIESHQSVLDQIKDEVYKILGDS